MRISAMIPYSLRLYLFRKKFHKQWQSKIFPANIFDMNCVKHVGRHSYGPIEVYTWGDEHEGLEIGSFVSVANDVTLVLGGNHPMNRLTTFPMGLDFEAFTRERPSTKGKIVIGDDVWIGMKSMILSGVTIGQGAVIMSGSIVTEDIPPYAVAGGIPARVIKYRFPEEDCTWLAQNLKWENMTDEVIRDHASVFTEPLQIDKVKQLVESIR